MSKRPSIILDRLKAGQSFTWTEPDGGDLASMRAAIKHGQTLTLSPMLSPAEIQVGDIVYVKWHNGHILHLVHEIQAGQFLIANSLGKVNGWVSGEDILGRVTHIHDPEPRPDVPGMLSELDAALRRLIEREQPAPAEAARLLLIVDDLRLYADRLGEARWYVPPQPNKWTFEQNLWHFTQAAKNALRSETEPAIAYMVDFGKMGVGLAAELLAWFEYGHAYWYQ